MIKAIYKNLDQKIHETLRSSDIYHRQEVSTGLWLGPLIGIAAITTFLREDNSYSEICLLVGITGIGLIICSLCLILQVSIAKTTCKDFQIIYFLPASITSLLYLLWANKGLLVSVSWGLGAGTLGTWGVLQLMTQFPRCFTFGEAIAVMHAIVLFITSCATNLPLRYHLPPLHDDDIATTILQVCIIFVGLLCLLCAFYPSLRSTKQFYVTTFGLLIIFIIPLLHILLDRSPVLWMLFYVFGNVRRIVLVVYWIICLFAAASILTYQILSESPANTAGRKSFHFLATFVYIPGLIWEPTLLYLASGTIMSLFVMLELLRILKIPPMGQVLQHGYLSFVDDKDSLVALSPLYLHVGLSFPLWMPTNSLELLPLLSGILTIGIGDAMASVVGVKWGKTKWSESNRTIEGTIACILSQLFVICGFVAFGFISNWWDLLRSTVAVIGVSLVEAQTDQIDNLALPLLFYISLII